VYDNAGLRIKKIDYVDNSTTIYIYSGQNILFEETYNTTNQTQLTAANRRNREFNVIAGNLNLAKYVWNTGTGWTSANGVVQYHLLDHLGSRQVVTDSSGNTINPGKVRYATFGSYEAGPAGEYSYTGKKRDTATGLTYINARYYDTVTGRFTSVDPKREGTNHYVYCHNNPISRIDKDGRSDCAAIWQMNMGWLPSADAQLPFADAIYTVGLAANGLADLMAAYGSGIPGVIDKIGQGLNGTNNNISGDPGGPNNKSIWEKIADFFTGRSNGGGGLKFGANDLVYGPSADGKLRDLANNAGGKLLTDMGDKPGGMSWLQYSIQTIEGQLKSGGLIRFDLTNMSDVAGALKGVGQFGNTITAGELSYLQQNWARFSDITTFYQNGVEVTAPW
jgi:RHS repeat-associated protein